MMTKIDDLDSSESLNLRSTLKSTQNAECFITYISWETSIEIETYGQDDLETEMMKF